jgi:hypothetical protein
MVSGCDISHKIPCLFSTDCKAKSLAESEDKQWVLEVERQIGQLGKSLLCFEKQSFLFILFCIVDKSCYQISKGCYVDKTFNPL